MLEKEYEFFSKNMADLYKQYGHKFLVIKDNQIIGAYDNEDVALKTTLKKEKLGTFLVQECVESPKASAHHFQGNVSFNFLG